MSISLALLGLIVGLLVWDTYKKRSYFKKLGVPGPPPLPLVGNLLSFVKGVHTAHVEWTEKYGKVFGIFQGARKSIVTSDLDMVEEVLVKQFNNFRNRKHFPLRPKLLENDLLSLRDERWKLVRSTISPTFSRSKMQKMARLVVDRCDVLLQNFKTRCEQGKDVTEISRMFGSFALETGALCAYALRIDVQNQQSSAFVTNADLFMRGFKKFQLSSTLTTILPWMEPLFRLLGCYVHPLEALDFFQKILRDLVHSRRSEPNQTEYVDFMQLIMKAHTFRDDDTPADEKVEVDCKRALTDDELVAGSMLFFIGNYETTTTTLSFTLYLLAKHPEVQERLIAEVDDVIGDRTAITYQDTNSLPYMDMVLHESLRMYPPAVLFDRICQGDCVIKGYRIPKGQMVEVPIWVIHHDPNVWPDPDVFDPERFAPGNLEKIHPMAWLPFGGGPRKCIGYRFATMEITHVVVRLLQKYRFEICEETEIPPNLGKRGLTMPDKGITLRVVPRKK